jgi:hypothetical protein
MMVVVLLLGGGGAPPITVVVFVSRGRVAMNAIAAPARISAKTPATTAVEDEERA